MRRIDADVTPPATPSRACHPLEQPVLPRILDRYPQYTTPLDMSLTPMKNVRAGHHYVLVAGLPKSGTYPRVLETFYPLRMGWPHPGYADDSETLVITPQYPSGLLDLYNQPVVKFRAVIDLEGQLILAKNGAGSRTVPFHHQLSFSSKFKKNSTLYYEDVIRNSYRNVLFAGELGFGKDGLLYYVSNRSGHFKPDALAFEALWDCLALNPDGLASRVYYQTYGEATPDEDDLPSISRVEIEARAEHLTQDQRQLLGDQEEYVVEVVSKRVEHPHASVGLWRTTPAPDASLSPLDLDVELSTNYVDQVVHRITAPSLLSRFNELS